MNCFCIFCHLKKQLIRKIQRFNKLQTKLTGLENSLLHSRGCRPSSYIHLETHKKFKTFLTSIINFLCQLTFSLAQCHNWKIKHVKNGLNITAMYETTAAGLWFLKDNGINKRHRHDIDKSSGEWKKSWKVSNCFSSNWFLVFFGFKMWTWSWKFKPWQMFFQVAKRFCQRLAMFFWEWFRILHYADKWTNIIAAYWNRHHLPVVFEVHSFVFSYSFHECFGLQSKRDEKLT